VNDVFAGFFALLVGLASSVVVFMLAKAKKKVADPADAKAPPRVFADHAREVLVEAFEEDVTAIQEDLKDANAAALLAQKGNSRSRKKREE
jgi:hypothetical protein|tara:strand:+ start:1019 stop:1291 length:273 start_codon:yes stop_codon:yes gene_type:complete